jgi:hypothetical protein
MLSKANAAVNVQDFAMCGEHGECQQSGRGRFWPDGENRDYAQNAQFEPFSTPFVSRFLGGCSASQKGHAKANSPVFTLRRSFSGTSCLRHFSSAMRVVYVLSNPLWGFRTAPLRRSEQIGSCEESPSRSESHFAAQSV